MYLLLGMLMTPVLRILGNRPQRTLDTKDIMKIRGGVGVQSYRLEPVCRLSGPPSALVKEK